jgi:Fe-S cluster biosynthesis and repair protein YggX
MSTPAERVQRIFDEAVGSDLNSWEKHQFLPSVKNRKFMTVDQEKIMRQIERKVFEEDDDE